MISRPHAQATGGASPGRRLGWLAIPAIALALVVYYRLKSGAGYPLDDSWIHLAFARQFAAGHGFGIHPGQWSTGSTAPLWTLLLAAGQALGLGHATWPWFLGTVALAATGLAAAQVLHRLRAGEPAPLLGGLLAMSTAGLVWSAAGAMETPLFTALLLLAWAEFLRGSRLWGIPAGLAMLARPEGLLFALLLALCARRVRSAIVNLALAAAMYAPYAVYCAVVSGRIWPSTFYAKTTRAIAGPPDVGYVLDSLGLIARLMPVLIVILHAGIALRLARRSGGPGAPRPRGWADRLARWRPILPGVLFVPALVLAYASMGRTFLFAGVAGNFGRYFFPLAPVLAVLGVHAVAGATAASARRQWVMTALAALVAWNGGMAVGRADFFAHNVRDINAMQVEMARRLGRGLPRGSLVAANDVGALACLTDLRVLDLVGIVSPEVQQVLFPLARADRRTRQEALFRLIVKLRPEAIVVFPQWYPEILQSLGPVLEPMEEIRVPDNITSGQSALVAYRLRWPAGGNPEVRR
jgi:hypothetical protein